MIINEIICDDALKKLHEIEDDSVDLLFTDPPYSTTNLKLDRRQFSLEKFMFHFKRVLKSNGWLFCFGSAEMLPTLLANFQFRFQYVWAKQAASPSHGSAVMPMHQHENIWVVCHQELTKFTDLYMDKKLLRTAGKPYIRPIRKISTEFGQSTCRPATNRTSRNPGYREGTTLLFYPNKVHFPIGEATVHPTQKPLAMCQLICKAYCPPESLILDPFMGSGTIPLASMMTGRKYIGIEIDKSYYWIAKSRFDGRLVNFIE